MSQRYCSCGAGSGEPLDPDGVPRLARHALGAVEPAHHRRPQLVEDLRVAVGPVQLPRHDHGGVAPAGRAVQASPGTPVRSASGSGHVGDGRRPATGRPATSRSHLVGEAGDVVEERRGRDEQLPVAGPAGRSRCGQSVGMSQALSRKLQTAASCSRSSRSSLQENQPRAAQVGVHDDAADVVGGERAGVALDADVPEAVRGAPRLEDVARDAGGDHASTCPAGSGSGRNGDVGRRCSMVTSPSGASASPWVSVIAVPAGPRSTAAPSR